MSEPFAWGRAPVTGGAGSMAAGKSGTERRWSQPGGMSHSIIFGREGVSILLSAVWSP